MNNQVVPPECAKILFRVSFLTLVSFIVANLLQVYDGVIVTALVFICSVNHWRRPEYGVRRNIDIINNILCLSYQTWRSFYVNPVYTIGFLSSTYTGVGCFFLGLHLDKTNVIYGTYLHSCVHILGNVGNVILYTGVRFSSPLASRCSVNFLAYVKCQIITSMVDFLEIHRH